MHRPYGTLKLDLIPFYPAVKTAGKEMSRRYATVMEFQDNYFMRKNAVGMSDQLASQFIGWI